MALLYHSEALVECLQNMIVLLVGCQIYHQQDLDQRVAQVDHNHSRALLLVEEGETTF